ncbi:MAG: hypothetical protein KKF62_18185 [Bacteroidetes bacterium]|nr:hypothetical protein [Bacteroidota bacterium]MBU1115066.1 hypothetical protein [Bacteroidota bacterium]MBU1797168.1 hypothetical protein [Bacteroidota bacterium]
MKINIAKIILVVSIIIISACSEVEKDNTEDLNVIISLNDKIIVDDDLSISYQVPQNWDEMPASLSDKLVARINKKGEDEFIVYSPKTFYYANSLNALLRIGKIIHKDSISNDSLSIEKYSALFQKFNNELQIETSNIRVSNFSILQMKIVRNNLMSFKYLFENHNREIIQFDFSINEENYLEVYPSIIASINSIKIL